MNNDKKILNNIRNLYYFTVKTNTTYHTNVRQIYSFIYFTLCMSNKLLIYINVCTYMNTYYDDNNNYTVHFYHFHMFCDFFFFFNSYYYYLLFIYIIIIIKPFISSLLPTSFHNSFSRV